jgi:hypothetical protein
MNLSPCANEYLKALTDPFNLGALPCVPDLVSFPSKKTRTIGYGTLAVGTAGVGFVCCTPLNFANDTKAGYYSTSSWTGSAIDLNSDTTGVSHFLDNQKPYSNTIITTQVGVNSRTVGCGLRVRYTGTELNRGGVVVALAMGDSSCAYRDFTSLATDPAAVRYPVSRGWKTICFRPSSSVETEFVQGVYAVANNGSDSSVQFRLAFIVTGTPGNTFEWEYISFSEFISGSGTISVPPIKPDGLSKSHTDLMGMSVTRDFLSQGRTDLQSSAGPDIYKMAYDWISKYSIEDVSRVAGTIGSGIKFLL